MSAIFKLVLVAIGLKARTIKNRLGWKSKMITPLDSSLYSNLEPFKGHQAIFSDYLSRNRQVTFGDNGSIFVLGRRFELNYFFKSNLIDKDDYLYVYTFFYLDFDISEISDEYFSKITRSQISKEPFVLSQQIFNLITDYNSSPRTDLYNYLYEQYKNLCNLIEYQVDGNHVIENFISICLFEIYFFDNCSNTKFLTKELARQTDEDGHLERNPKYTFDILIKTLVISDLLDSKSIKHDLGLYIDRLKSSLEEFYHSSFFSHDNIIGDALSEDIERLIGTMPRWSPNKLLSVRSVNGMSGHSFDCSRFAPLPANLRCFGTYHYANTLKRKFQRKRINNAQLCFDNRDQSIWFWKSFRVLFKLPGISFRTNVGTFVMELVISKSRLRLLSYHWKVLKNGWKYESSEEFLYKVYVDDLPLVNQSVIICDKFKIVLSTEGTVSVKPTIRANALGSLVKSYSLMTRSKSLTLIQL